MNKLKYIIITTYPKSGSQNIGDKLIESSTKQLISDLKGDCEFITFWRGEDLSLHLDTINNSNGLIFSCLAVRQKMFPDTYKLVNNISDIKVPIIILAAGTSIPPANLENDFFGTNYQYSKKDENMLKELSKKYHKVSCRGEVTYNNLKNIGIKNATMTGDVAFYDPRFDDLHFRPISKINSIAVSTPHSPKSYSKHFYTLLEKLRTVFPKQKITVFVHGVSDWIDKSRIINMNCDINEIYKKNLNELDEYINYDIHIGYRVHAHVSALKRRVPSYLICTDGRGFDYASTLNIGTAFKGWKSSDKFSHLLILKAKQLLMIFRNKSLPYNHCTSIEVNYEIIDYIVDLVHRDKEEAFNRFIGFEKEIFNFNQKLKLFLKDV